MAKRFRTAADLLYAGESNLAGIMPEWLNSQTVETMRQLDEIEQLNKMLDDLMPPEPPPNLDIIISDNTYVSLPWGTFGYKPPSVCCAA